jgi:hypothetical protein
MSRFSYVVSWLAVLVPLYSPAQDQSPLRGVVTDPGSPSAFTVDGLTVLCTSATESVSVNATAITDDGVVSKTGDSGKGGRVKSCPRHFLGENVTVYGQLNRETRILTANRVEQKTFVGTRVVGMAVIDRMLKEGPVSIGQELTIRADGYRIVIGKTTKSVFDLPMNGPEDIQTNVWIRYSGRLQPDGTVLADDAVFSRNVLEKREQRLREKDEFDPNVVDEDDRQRHISKAIHGLDAHRIPAYHDEAMQMRVDALGARLIPTFQRMLSNDDPTKINFRFQLVDQNKLRDGLALPSGIILVPYQVVLRLQSDSLLATILADGIAATIEKEGLRELPAEERMKALQIAGTAGGFFVPGLGFLTGFANHTVKNKISRINEAQSGRVGLGLLRDAGFDITQAPLTWWLLASPKPRDLKEIKMPFRARALYGVLATTWRQDLALSPE